jgi:mono/diheme cytochrome c family protein
MYLNRITQSFVIIIAALVWSFVGGNATAEDRRASTPTEIELDRGKAIFREKCAFCHGDAGQGVTDQHAQPLIGDYTVGELSKVIADTMPKDEPELCVGDDARAVAAYIHQAFYGEAAQLRNRPPRHGLSRMTAAQLRQSLADLYASIDGVESLGRKVGGAHGIYFDGSRWKEEKKKLDRIDPAIDFDFGREAPVDGVSPNDFYIYWEGSLLVEESGRYDIVVDSTCSFTMEFGRIGRVLIDNHVQSGDKTRFHQSLNLTAGRFYPFKIEFIQRKRKTEQPPAKISLRWVPPQGVETPIPSRNLSPEVGPPSYALQTNLPPDDRSYGYERGIAVSRQWDDSVTNAAIEFGRSATDELWPRYQEKHRSHNVEDREKLKQFMRELVNVAFRGCLTEDRVSDYVDHQIKDIADDAEAIRLVWLLAIKSPYFLYHGIDSEVSPSQRNANRLSQVLFDSIPTDRWLLNAIDKNQLTSEADVREAASKMVRDERAQAKLRMMLQEWLSIGQPSEITKSDELFPGFDRSLAADLRLSMNLLLNDIIESPDCDYRRLFDTNWLYTTDRLSQFYGQRWEPTNPAEQPSRTIAMPGERFGILTHPYLMSRLAYHDATSPIHRGVFLIRYLLGRSLKPPNEAFTPLSPDLHPDLTTRERVALQTRDQNCQACHIKINGLGFTLENYDAVGRFQGEERGKTIDPRGSYTSRSGETIDLNGAAELAKFMVESEDARLAFVSRAFQYFVKQPPAAYGLAVQQELADHLVENDYNIRDLVVEIAVVASRH